MTRITGSTRVNCAHVCVCVCVCVCVFLTFLCLPLLSLKHLLLWWQSLLQELHVELVLLLHFLLLPKAHLIADVAFEAEAQRYHGVADATAAERDREARCKSSQVNLQIRL